MSNQKYWFVKHPTCQYKEDVKSLARQNNLKIVDARFESEFKDEVKAKDAPKLTPIKDVKKDKGA